MIFLYPVGGIGNRLRAIASAYKLAVECDTKIKVFWRLSDELNCPFEKIFSLNTDIITVKNVSKSFFCFYRRIRFPKNYDIHNDLEAKSFLTLFKNNPKKNYFVCSEYHFYDGHDYSFISPTKLITDKVDSLLGSIPKQNRIAVQIRRTDNTNSISVSPLELFATKMMADARENPEVKFYLATDDIATRQALSEQFGDKIIYNPAETISRKTVSGIIDAMVDFIAMSRCHKIYGSYWSSFSEVARDIGNNQLVVIKKN